MLTFKKFYLFESDDGKLKHLEHAEDHVLNDGKEGFKHAVATLWGVHKALQGKKTFTSTKIKKDGSPSIVFGHHPQTGKFFVASKSVFNKNPKINYTPEDIEKNHGHAPGLVEKLKDGLKHLPKITPSTGVYQGDFMYSKGDVQKSGGKYHFKPNTITYSTPTDSEAGKKIAKAHIGVAIHTEYHGTDLQNMKAHFNPDMSKFKEHPHVHVVDVNQNFKKTQYPKENRKGFKEHMSQAVEHFKRMTDDHFNTIEKHKDHMKVYINSTVKDGTKPTADGFVRHLEGKKEKDLGTVKTEKSKTTKAAKWDEVINHAKTNAHHIQDALSLHHSLQNAKNHLVSALSSHQEFEHSIDGKPSRPEGFVSTLKNKPTKLVDRAEFSRANFLARPR